MQRSGWPRVTSRHNTDWSETCKSNFSMEKNCNNGGGNNERLGRF